MAPVDELRDRLGEIFDLSRAASLLAWDERTMMPAAGSESRARQLGTLAKVRHEMFCDDAIGSLVEKVDPADDVERDLVRIVERDWRKARLVPSSLRAEMARASSVSENAWVEAKANSDYAMLLPHLRENVELTKRYAECYSGFEGFEHPYDPLLDEYEPEMSTEQMRSVLGDLRDGLVPLVARAAAEPPEGDDIFRGSFDPGSQRELVADLISELPFPDGGYRLDPTEHPFAITIGVGDVRLTTRYDEDNLSMALFSALHEAGHGLYESGVDPALDRTPLAKPRSLGLHESQSRLWENWVARGRPYLGHVLPKLAGRFPDPFGSADVERLYGDANRIERSLIRIEADELTYNLHILIRFELELELFEGKVTLEELPEAWNARYKGYLGLDVPDDARGVLQDVHWAGGAFGYFPTYSLGNIIAGQLFEAASSDIADLDERIGRGDLAALGDWLREKVHRHGRRRSPAEVLEGAGCGPLSVGPLLAHLERRADGV